MLSVILGIIALVLFVLPEVLSVSTQQQCSITTLLEVTGMAVAVVAVLVYFIN